MRRPLSGALAGILLGLAVAVVLQQHGLWPLDRLTVFLLPGLVGLLAILMTSMGREGSAGTLTIALVITIPLAAWGGLGFGEINETGRVDGGCEVVAASDIDATTVTDTRRVDPFEIDPDGGLTWEATSPSVLMDYPWVIWTEIGGFEVTLDSEDSEPNEDEVLQNGGDMSHVTAYAASRGIDVDELRGVFIVGGEAASTCDGFGFVSIVAEPFATLASKIAAVVALLALLALFLLALTRRPEPGGRPIETGAGHANGPGAGVAAGLAATEGADRPEQGPEAVDDDGNGTRESGLAPGEGTFDDPDAGG